MSDRSNLAPSLVRTGAPFAVGVVGSWLAQRGLSIDDDVLSTLLVGLIGYLYYVAARFLEVFASPKWGYVLGVKGPPQYEPPAGDAVVLGHVDDDTGRLR